MIETLPITSGAVAEWLPWWQAAGFFCATFVLEDAAAIGAGLLLAAGRISWPAAFLACFLGIWLGDMGLYALARFAGRNWFEKLVLKKHSAKVARSENWFRERGTTILIFSRAIPGTRLPTYLAAGFLRVPLARFLIITGAAALVWTFIILFLTQVFGAHITQWLGRYQSGSLFLLGAGILLVVALQMLRRALMNFDWRKFSTGFARWTRWEFWPMWLFYPPVAIHCLWLAVKYRGTMLPTVANPGIFSGGIVGESKMQTLRDLMNTSPEFTAEAELLTGDSAKARLISLHEICARTNISHPFILKPDLGQRGAGIKLIRNESQAEDYLKETSWNFLLSFPRPAARTRGCHHGKIFSGGCRQWKIHHCRACLAGRPRPLHGREISATTWRTAKRRARGRRNSTTCPSWQSRAGLHLSRRHEFELAGAGTTHR